MPAPLFFVVFRHSCSSSSTFSTSPCSHSTLVSSPHHLITTLVRSYAVVHSTLMNQLPTRRSAVDGWTPRVSERRIRYVIFHTFQQLDCPCLCRHGLLVEPCTLKRGCALIYCHAMWRWTETDFGISPDSEFQTCLPASRRERTNPLNLMS